MSNNISQERNNDSELNQRSLAQQFAVSDSSNCCSVISLIGFLTTLPMLLIAISIPLAPKCFFAASNNFLAPEAELSLVCNVPTLTPDFSSSTTTFSTSDGEPLWNCKKRSTPSAAKALAVSRPRFLVPPPSDNCSLSFQSHFAKFL